MFGFNLLLLTFQSKIQGFMEENFSLLKKMSKFRKQK